MLSCRSTGTVGADATGAMGAAGGSAWSAGDSVGAKFVLIDGFAATLEHAAIPTHTTLRTTSCTRGERAFVTRFARSTG